MEDMPLSEAIRIARKTLAETYDLVLVSAPGDKGQMIGRGPDGNAAARAYNRLAAFHSEAV